MTEDEWLVSERPDLMLALHARHRRKLRLFACTCCRQVWNPFVPPFVIRAVTAAEAFADGEVGAGELARVFTLAEGAALAATVEASRGGSNYLAHVASGAMYACIVDARRAADQALWSGALAAADLPVEEAERRSEMAPEYAAELAAQADLLRDIFGNPFRSSELRLEWLTSDVLALARGIYDERAFDRMPILADALQDAGCDDEDILSHCREPREHVRGCWVVDLLLGKK